MKRNNKSHKEEETAVAVAEPEPKEGGAGLSYGFASAPPERLDPTVVSMLPTPGRIVLFCHPEDPQVQSPAIVQRANADGTLGLWVFADAIQRNEQVSAGGPDGDVPTPGCWIWPPRQGKRFTEK